MQENEENRAEDGLPLSASMFDSISGLDAERGFDVFEGDIEDYAATLRSFIKNAPATIEKLRGVTEDNLSEYAVHIHGLKAISGWICADGIQAGAMELETLAKAGDFSGVSALNGKLLKDTEALLKDLRALLGDNSA